MTDAPRVSICFWLNFPSIHQTPLLRALATRTDVDLQVRYFDSSAGAAERQAQGWTIPVLERYESYLEAPCTLADVPRFDERVHIVPGIQHHVCAEVVKRCEAIGTEWCHWSERSGIRAFSMTGGHPVLSRVVRQAVNVAVRWKYARRINASALGVFATGVLAENDFVSWGVRRDLIKHLYYSTEDIGIPTGACTSADSDRTAELTFLYLGALCRRKATSQLIRAFSRAAGTSTRLVLAGKDMSGGRYKELARKLGVDDQIEWLGPVPFNQVVKWLGVADVVVLPSLFDGWGAVLNEGACAGKALISTTECGAAWHLIHDCTNGFRIRAGSEDALAWAMTTYIRRPSLASEHGRASREIYCGGFTAAHNAERLVAAIWEWRNRGTRSVKSAVG